MIYSRKPRHIAAAIALAASLGAGAAIAEQQADPAAAAPAADVAAPAAEVEAAPAAEAPVEPVAREAAPQAAPAATEAAAEPAQPAEPQSVVVTAKDLKIGTAVFAADGSKIGEVNRISSDASGAVSGIEVTFGEPAGLNAKAFAVAAGQIVGLKGGVKLSLSAEQAKSQPPVDGTSG